MRNIFDMNEIKRLLPKDFDKIITKKIKGHYFIFDKESLEEYKKFDDYLFNITIINGYLAREMKCDKEKITFFHEWLIREQVEEFKEKYKLFGKNDIEVHHITMCKRINIKKYLQPHLKKDHRTIMHGGYYGKPWLKKQDKLF